MANYMGTTRTNYFRVTDENRYQELFSRLRGEDDIRDFTKEKDGILYHGFGTYGCIEYEDEDGELYLDDFFNELQKILPDDEAFMFFESGHEKLRYVTGVSVIVTKKEIVSESMVNWAIKKAKELLGNDFETQTDY